MAKFSDARVSAMLRGKRAFRVYGLPGYPELQVAVRCLSEAEGDEVEEAALAALAEIGKRRGWSIETVTEAAPELHQRLLQRHTVFRACFDPETIESKEPARFFKSAAEIGAELDAADVSKLYERYLEHQEWVNPLYTLDEAGAKELAAALGKDPSGAALFAGYERSTLVRLLIASLRLQSTT